MPACIHALCLQRVTLEDLYRGVQKLDGREACALAALLATTTKKVPEHTSHLACCSAWLLNIACVWLHCTALPVIFCASVDQQIVSVPLSPHPDLPPRLCMKHASTPQQSTPDNSLPPPQANNHKHHQSTQPCLLNIHTYHMRPSPRMPPYAAPQILPPDSLNINQLNLREALMAASAARQLPVERAVPGDGKCPGLQIMTERGAPPEAILEAGYRPVDALKAGYAPHAVVSAAQHDLRGLKDAGVSVRGCLTAPCVPQLAARLQEGPRGLLMLKRAGYTLQDVMEGGLGQPWELKRVGFSFEVRAGGGWGRKAGTRVRDVVRAVWDEQCFCVCSVIVHC